ncbi:homeobox protein LUMINIDEPENDENS isoform X2 [Prunus yedoensis var. nudiflora]|uniref:Homeobox protein LUMINIDEPENDENS isoform X2 n=1 Tax=Prunus yedoensis var. nudiflora TaxID=2094558 RepID=A0A314Y4Q5_PRUYE|nr:homeobox protein LUMINIDEPENDENS isoform X2 [Prunus yedoensis var. nudiflora]
MEDLSEMEIGSSVESFQKFLDSQRQLFHSQIDQLQKVVVTQCHLTGVNPLSQEMAAGALSVKIGKRPRDLLNPKAIKYMQSVFSIKDAISKKESRELSALFGVTGTQVRDFFNSQRSRVRKLVQLSREKATRSSEHKELQDGVSTSSDPLTPIDPVPLNSVGPSSVEDAPSCSTQDDALSGLDDLDKHFVDNIFNLIRERRNVFWASETDGVDIADTKFFSIMLTNLYACRFLNTGGVMILATWLSQAAIEEQTSVLLVILKVLCHLPLHKALPLHMSAILQSVNRLRFYRTADVSNRARVLLSRWSKLLARIQDMKKPNGMKTSSDSQHELVMLKQSIDEVMGDESWKSNIDIPEDIFATPFENAENSRRPEASEPLKLLTASSDESNKKQILGVSSSQFRARRKVQLVEQPGQKSAGRSVQVTRATPVSKGSSNVC